MAFKLTLLMLEFSLVALAGRETVYRLKETGKINPELKLFLVKSRISCSKICSESWCASYSYSNVAKMCGISMNIVADKRSWVNSTGFTYWERYVYCPSTFTLLIESNITKCIKFYDVSKDFSASRTTCEDGNGHLLQVDSEAATLMINNYVSYLANTSSSPVDDIRIGLFVDNLYIFTWPDGSRISYRNWGVHQPDRLSETSVMMKKVDGYKWYDINKSQSEQFICEMNVEVY